MGNVIYVQEQNKCVQDRKLRIGCMGIKVNVLGYVGHVSFNPFISDTSYTINIEFVIHKYQY